MTVGLVELINLDQMAGLINAFSETAAWISFRTVLGIEGAEAEENLMFVAYVAVSVVVSAATVATVNRLTVKRRGPPARP